MKEWRDLDCGWYDLFITEIDSENPIATLKDEKISCPEFWADRLRSTPKSFLYCGSTSNSVFERNLNSENLEDAKAELEKILLDSSKEGLKQADKNYRKCKEYCRKMVRYLSDSSVTVEDMRVIEIPEKKLEKLMLSYIEDRNYMIKKENECDTEEELEALEDDDIYGYHVGRCEVAEAWFGAIGVSPYDKFIRTRLIHEKN